MTNFSCIGSGMVLRTSFVFFYSISSAYAALDLEGKTAVNPVSNVQLLNWFLGLIAVLSIFFACVWFMRKMGALPIQKKENMRVVGGLSLGMREKLILVQIGNKQLVLGVSPGKIENLLVLEGEQQLNQEKQGNAEKSDFSGKLKQIMAETVGE